MKISERIRTLRQKQNLTQDYMAEMLGIDTVNYGRIERGQTKITVCRLERIAKILGVKPTYFFEDTEEDIKHIKKIVKKNLFITRKLIKEIQLIKEQNHKITNIS